ncbi:hypothetical protein [Actinoplanes sp. M2I2]|uniref:hypothetical protein n=1 Tax=Actinoplanes sp. M2I2 TaxID=1734444 RepID=UPI00201FD5C6|nr:hypothetical protein [Actinoplanes sp. M2I2]
MHPDVVAEQAQPGLAVSGGAALHRAATGLGVSAAMFALVGLVWREGLEGAFPLLLGGSLLWLHESDDRHHTSAALAAGAVALAVVVGVAVLFRHAPTDFSHDVAGAAVGAMAGSQVYAAVTRRA